MSVATYDPRGEGGDDALLVGVLAGADTCLMIATETGSILPVFPSDEVHTDPEGSSFRGVALRDGEQIALGGGEGKNLSWLRDDTVVHVPEACAADTPFWVVAQQPDGRAALD